MEGVGIISEKKKVPQITIGLRSWITNRVAIIKFQHGDPLGKINMTLVIWRKPK